MEKFKKDELLEAMKLVRNAHLVDGHSHLVEDSDWCIDMIDEFGYYGCWSDYTIIKAIGFYYNMYMKVVCDLAYEKDYYKSCQLKVVRDDAKTWLSKISILLR